MEPERFDAMAKGMASGSTRRTLVGGTLGGAVATVLSRFGAAAAKDQPNGAGKGKGGAVAAQHCAPNGQRCGKKRPLGTKHNHPCKKCCSRYAVRLRNGKRKCACKPAGRRCGNPSQCCSGVCRNGRCASVGSGVVAQRGSGTATPASAAGCQLTPQGCTSTIAGAVRGTPIDGTFAGSLTGTNYQPGAQPGSYTADAAGTVTLTEGGTGETLALALDGDLAGTGSGTPGETATFTGTYTITGGTGRFRGATGSGAATSQIAVPTGTLTAVTLDGTITLA